MTGKKKRKKKERTERKKETKTAVQHKKINSKSNILLMDLINFIFPSYSTYIQGN